MPATSLAEHGAAPSADAALAELWSAWTHGSSYGRRAAAFRRIRDAWLAAAIGLGSDLAVVLDGRVVRGCFEGLGGDGAMLLRLADGTLRPLHSGEVRFARARTRAPA